MFLINNTDRDTVLLSAVCMCERKINIQQKSYSTACFTGPIIIITFTFVVRSTLLECYIQTVKPTKYFLRG